MHAQKPSPLQDLASVALPQDVRIYSGISLVWCQIWVQVLGTVEALGSKGQMSDSDQTNKRKAVLLTPQDVLVA